jgi:RNA methyltransferase, TrmH family
VLDNPRSPRVRAVAKLAKKQRRHEAKLFLVEGPQAVREALLHRPELVVDIFLTQTVWDKHSDVVALAQLNAVELTLSTEAVIAQMADTVSPQGIVGVVQFLGVSLKQVFGTSPRLIALLHEVQDPGNVGNILRTADAAGVDAVVVTSKSVDVYNPKVVRSTTGSLFHVPVVTGVELDEVIRGAKKAGMQVFATDAGGEDLVSLRISGVLAKPTVWLLGNEAQGLSAEEQEAGDRIVSVPLYGSAESLSLQTAAAVCLYESAFAQHSGG